MKHNASFGLYSSVYILLEIDLTSSLLPREQKKYRVFGEFCPTDFSQVGD